MMSPVHQEETEHVKPCIDRLPSGSSSTVCTTASSPTTSVGSRDHPEDLSSWAPGESFSHSICHCRDNKAAVDDAEPECGERKLLWRSTSSELHFSRRSSKSSSFILDEGVHSPLCRSQSGDETLCEEKDALVLKRRSPSTCSTFTVDCQRLSYSGVATLSLVCRDNVGAGYAAKQDSRDLGKFNRETASGGDQELQINDVGLMCRTSKNMSNSVFFTPPLKVGAAHRGDDTISFCWRGMKQLFTQISGSRTRQHAASTETAHNGILSDDVSKPTKLPLFEIKKQTSESLRCCNDDDQDLVVGADKSRYTSLIPSYSFNGDFGSCIPAKYSFLNVDEVSPSTVQRVSIATLDDAIWRVATKIYQHIRRGNRLPVTADSELFREELYALPSRNNIRMRCKTFRQYPSPSNTFITEVSETFKAEVCSFSKVFKFIRLFVFKAELSCEILVMALIYIERILSGSSVVLRSNNWRPIVMSSLLVASKVHDDFSSWNVELTVIFPEYTLSSVNRLERALCRALNYSLVVDWQQYAVYYQMLQRVGNPPWTPTKIPAYSAQKQVC